MLYITILYIDIPRVNSSIMNRLGFIVALETYLPTTIGVYVGQPLCNRCCRKDDAILRYYS